MEDKIDKIENTITLSTMCINDLKNIKDRIEKSETENIRIKIETKHWYGFSEPFLGKEKHKLNVSKYSAIKLIDAAIQTEKDKINKLIDMEIEERTNPKPE